METKIELGADGVTRERVFHATKREAWTHPYTERLGCSVCVARIERTTKARRDLTRPATSEELRVPREELLGATIETTELLADPTDSPRQVRGDEEETDAKPWLLDSEPLVIDEEAAKLGAELGLTPQDNPQLWAEMRACLRADLESIGIAEAREIESA